MNQLTLIFHSILEDLIEFLSQKMENFRVQQGAPSENFERPVPLDDALEIATVKLEPYLLSPDEASVSFLDHKRYRMSDIKKLEDRIRSLEYYTTLSLLEVNTESMFISRF